MKVPRAFATAFAAVHAAFATSPEEIEEAKVVARADLVSAEDAYYASAAMIRAGWEPLKEQMATFLARTGFVLPQRWPVTPTEVQVRWPSLSLEVTA